MIIGTKAEFEQLADFILRDYLGNTYDGYDPLDIQAFAKDYLKLDISYFAFDPDTGIEGMRTGNQIILDDRLLDDKKAGERNFTIAHECGHDLINWQDPSYSPQTVVNYRIKSSGKSLVTEDDFKEWQAGQVWPHLQISLVIGTICPDEFGCVTGIPAPYKNSSGLIISTSPLLLL